MVLEVKANCTDCEAEMSTNVYNNKNNSVDLFDLEQLLFECDECGCTSGTGDIDLYQG